MIKKILKLLKKEKIEIIDCENKQISLTYNNNRFGKLKINNKTIDLSKIVDLTFNVNSENGIRANIILKK